MNRKDEENVPPNAQASNQGDPQGEGNSPNGKYKDQNADKD